MPLSTTPPAGGRQQSLPAVGADLAIGRRRSISSTWGLTLAATLHLFARVTRLVDVGLLPCGRSGGPVWAGLDAFGAQLAPLGRVPRQLCVVLGVGGAVSGLIPQKI